MWFFNARATENKLLGEWITCGFIDSLPQITDITFDKNTATNDKENNCKENNCSYSTWTIEKINHENSFRYAARTCSHSQNVFSGSVGNFGYWNWSVDKTGKIIIITDDKNRKYVFKIIAITDDKLTIKKINAD